MLERVRHLRPSRPASLLILGGLVGGYLGCSDDPVPEANVTHPTLVQVAPEDFLGDLPCIKDDRPGLKRYVASAYDVTGEAGAGAGGAASEEEPEDPDAVIQYPRSGFKLPSSLPVSCAAQVGFGLVVPGRYYRVRIDGYETHELQPRASGSRIMVPSVPEDGSGPELKPTWRADCAPAIAVDQTIIRAHACTWLIHQPPTGQQLVGPAEVRISTQGLLGDLECGDDAEQVALLSVSLTTAEGTVETATVACGEDAVFSDLSGRHSLSATVRAFSADSTLTFAGSTCQVSTVPGSSVYAQCTRLSTTGTLRIDFTTALEAVGLACDASLRELRVEVPGEDAVAVIVPPDCQQPYDHTFAAGPALVTVSAVPRAGETVVLSCQGEVVPGAFVPATCDPTSDP